MPFSLGHRASVGACGGDLLRRLSAAAVRGGRTLALLSPALLLAACAKQVPSAVNHADATPGFLLGLWHGFIFPVAWVLSLFMPDVAIYAVPNNGGWYDFGYFIGVVFLGVGARKTRTVYVTRRAGR
ncbi:hypothetical protein [Sphingomonas sp. IC-11]|uniref:hypothetical protein n=1 Tax=Sphingomonas sp. IC-11 TaxID=2898528 RepID=UPI003FA723C3